MAPTNQYQETETTGGSDWAMTRVRFKQSLRRFFARGSVEIAIGVLVIVSVVLTLCEFALESKFASGVNPVATILGPMSSIHLRWMELINEIITIVFVVELSLRYYAARSKRRYFAEFWLDILATIPVFRVFRSARALRLLRLIRLMRLLGIISRLSINYPYVLRQGAADFLMICALLVLAVLFGTLAITHFERGNGRGLADSISVSLTSGAVPMTPPPASDAGLIGGISSNADNTNFDLSNSFWFSVYTLFAGEPVPQTPHTLSGKVVSVFLMFMGLTIFAIFAGTVSAFMVDRLRMEGRVVDFDELTDHIVICGWTPKTPIIISEYRSGSETKNTPIVVITQTAHEELDLDQSRSLPNVHFVHDDFTKVSALERAGILTAQTCLVLSDISGGRSEQDADARTILGALTVEKMNEKVYTCAELFNRSYASHLDLGKVNDYVVSEEYGAHMLAQAAMTRGLIGVFSELLTYQRGNEFYRIQIPPAWVGSSFDEKLSQVRETANIILVAVVPPGAEPIVNPDHYLFQEFDEVVVIGKNSPKLT